MDISTYMVLYLRQIFGTEPEECIECVQRLMPKEWDQKCDHASKAKFKFPNGGIGTIDVDLALRGSFGQPVLSFPKCIVTHLEVAAEDDKLPAGQEHVLVKTVIFKTTCNPCFGIGSI